MAFLDWLKDKASAVGNFFTGKKEEPKQEAPVSITPASFPSAPLTTPQFQPKEENKTLLEQFGNGVKDIFQDNGVASSVVNATVPTVGVTRNLIDFGKDFFFGKEENSDKSDEQIKAKDEFNKMAEEYNVEKSGKLFGGLSNIFGIGKISDSNLTSAVALSREGLDEFAQGEISPRVSNIFNAVNDSYSKPENVGSLYGSMRSQISSGEKKKSVKGLANDIISDSSGEGLSLVAKYIDNPELAIKDGINTEILSSEYNNIKTEYKLDGVDDVIVKDIMKRAYSQKGEAQANIKKQAEKIEKMKSLYKVYDPVGYAEYTKDDKELKAIVSKSNDVYRKQRLANMEKNGTAIRINGELVPTANGQKYLGNAEDDHNKFTSTLYNMGQQNASIVSIANSKGIDMGGQNVVNKNIEQIISNKLLLDDIRDKVTMGKGDMSDRDVQRLVSDEVRKTYGYNNVNQLLSRGVVGIDGEPIGGATALLTPQDIIMNQVRENDQWMRFNSRVSAKNFLSILNNVGTVMTSYTAGFAGEVFNNAGIISDLSRADIGYMSDINPDGSTKSVGDLWYNMTNRILDAAPETASLGLNMAAISSATTNAAQSLKLAQGIRAGGMTKNIINSLSRLSIKSIPENIMQNALFHGVDTGINTPDQLAFDAFGTVLGAGFDMYGQVAGLARYAKNKEAIETAISNRQVINAITDEIGAIKTNNPNMTESEVITSAVKNIKEKGFDKQRVELSLGEVKQVSEDMKRVVNDINIRKSSMSPQEAAQLDALQKTSFTQARIWDDILSKEAVTDADLFRYNQILSSAGTKSVLFGDLVRVIDKVLPESKKKISNVLSDMMVNKNADNAVARLDFSFTNPQEISYIQKITQKIAPEGRYSLEDLGEIAKSISDELVNPLGLQKDLLEKNADGYRYFRKTDGGDYVLNSEGFKKLGIIDNRGSKAVAENTLGGENFYKAVEDSGLSYIDANELDMMRKSKTYEQLKEKIMDVVPC